jgi:F-type H+-transporting ATPase subunit b
MLSLDGTLVVQLINFIVFLAIVNVIFFRPVGIAIAKRRAYIDGLKADIEELHTDAKMIRARAEERRAAARREAAELMAKARGEASAEADRIVAEAQGRAVEIVKEAHVQVDNELVAARVGEQRLVDELANDMLARAIGGAA